MGLLNAGERVRAQVRAARIMGVLRKTPGKVPRQQPPALVEKAYAAAIRRLVSRARVREAFAPLLEELPRLLETARRELRGDEAREDAGESKRVRELIEAARQRLAASTRPAEVEAIAREFAVKTQTWQRMQMNKQVKSALGIDVLLQDPRLPALLEAFVDANVGLIRNITDSIAAGTEASVMAAVRSGKLSGDLADELDKRFGYGERRAALIARDQIGTLYGQVNAARQRELGVKKFMWRTVHDDRVRDEHDDIDGDEFSYDDPPHVGTNDEPVLPGEAINCRCMAEPVFDDILADL